MKRTFILFTLLTFSLLATNNSSEQIQSEILKKGIYSFMESEEMKGKKEAILSMILKTHPNIFRVTKTEEESLEKGKAITSKKEIYSKLKKVSQSGQILPWIIADSLELFREHKLNKIQEECFSRLLDWHMINLKKDK